MKTHVCVMVLVMIFLQHAFAQENDNCHHALLLEVGDRCEFQGYSGANATEEEISVAPDPTCGSYAGGDVWFKVKMPASGGLRIEVDNLQGATPPSFTLYSGSCGNFSEVICVRNDHHQTVYQPALAEDTLYIRVYSFFSRIGGDFSLCVFEPLIPQNDLCENARFLEVGESCRLDTLSNAYATAQSDTVAPEPACGFYQGGDVWFQAIMPASGVLRINKNRISGATHPSMTIYAGHCGNFVEVLCSENDPTETLHDLSLAGQILYLRLYSFNEEEGASFSLCLFEEAAPENDDCEDALPVSVGDRCSVTHYSNTQATSQPSTTAPDPSCGAYQGGDVWFTVEMPASGALQIETEHLSGVTPPSVALYSGSCGNFEEVACMRNDNRQTFFEPLLAGQTLYMRVYTFNSDDGGTFSLCVFEPSFPPNDQCEEAITLPVGETCLLEPYTNAYASTQPDTIAPEPSCGQYQGGDVWYKVIMPASGLIQIETDNLEGSTDPSITLYSGACGNFTEVGCGQPTPYLLLDRPDLAGDTVYLRLYHDGHQDGGGFALCAFDPGCVPDTVDAGQVAICEGESYVLGTQTITQTGAYTELFQSSSGCDSLVTLSVTVNEVNTTLLQDGETLTAQAEEASFQWIDCIRGNELIAGETEQTFTADASGEYAAIITKNGCTDTSACYSMHVVGLTDDEHAEPTLFPNPAGKLLHIELPRPYAYVRIDLVTMKSQIIKTARLHRMSMAVLDLHDIVSGVYVVKIYTEEGFTSIKIIKE